MWINITIFSNVEEEFKPICRVGNQYNLLMGKMWKVTWLNIMKGWRVK